MALHLHRASRTDQLADGLGELLARPLADPFERDVVVVPARGVERWLTQRLSHRLGVGARGGDGVCAGVRFLSPPSLIALLLDQESDDPWAPDRLVWPLLDVIDASLSEPWCAALARHLGHGEVGEAGEVRQGRRYSVARRLATLFATYAVQRPSLIEAWSRGHDTDGVDQALDQDLVWQAELWRRLVAQADSPPPQMRQAETLARLKAGDPTLDLPARLSLFGHTRIAASEAELLAALARQRDVHLWLPQASPTLWDKLGEDSVSGAIRRVDDTTGSVVRHPLLASLGRDARELNRTIGPLIEVDHPVAATEGDPQTLLGWLQADLRTNQRPERVVRAARHLTEDDRSVQVHACHGPHRQIDVLREVLVGLLQDDPTLEPRDILVMCPDIETYAPLIQSGFGLGEAAVGDDPGHPAHRLRVSLADRSLLATNPLLGVASTLVELAGGRVTAAEVLDLLGSEPVRKRFGFDDDDLGRISGWVDAANIRWGLDPGHRAAFAMERFGHNTWRAGLDRILVGVAMSADDFGHVGPALPLDDVGSSDIELVGRLAECVDRLERCLRQLQDARGAESWLTALGEGVRALTDVPRDALWQVAQFEREFARACAAADASGGGQVLRLADIRALLQTLVVARPTRANFRTGTLSVCTLVPMRSVPHRVVCLVGLDDGLFPRAGHTDGDDILSRAPLTGERDLRSEDRQLLLDAIMSAGETLVLCFTGADEHTGASRPPAVPLDEVLDAVSRTAGDDPRGLRQRVLTRHPLQPYDARNFRAQGLIDGPEVFSFDQTAEQGARAGAGPRHPRPAFLASPLPAVAPAVNSDGADLNLADLKAFFTHPVRAFLRNRLQIGIPLEHDEMLNAIPIELGPLDKWDIGDRLLRQVMAGRDSDGLMLAEQLSGTLPPGDLGQNEFAVVAGLAQGLITQTAPLREGRARTLDVSIDLGAGRLLTGTVGGVFGNRIVSLTYSRLGAKQRLMSWLDLLALSVAFPDESWTAHAVGKGRGGTPTRSLAGPLDHQASGWLRELVALYDEGQCRPLPAPIKTACAWAEGYVQAQMGSDRTPAESATRVWVTDLNNAFNIPGEQADAWHRRVFGEASGLDALLSAGLADVAWRIWQPLLTGAEKVGPL